jgi:thiosulfate/3-mercaptopyruvate sulfurtransferase
MAFTTLMSTPVLAARILPSRVDDPNTVVVDCRFKLDDTGWGEREHLTAHIPGAVYAHLDRDLSGVKTGANGRHPLPEVAALRETLGRLGIASGVQVVAYDQDNGMFASRVWWLLRWMGHDAAAVLDGGFARWTAEGRPTRAGDERRPPQPFSGEARREMVADAAAVAAIAGRPDWRLIDARAPERFRGEVEPLDKVPGHIPGAINHFFGGNVDERGVFRSAEELRALWQESIDGVSSDRIVCYCGSGVTACHNLLALEHAGISGARLYPGSWSEWCSDPARPVSRETR